MSFSLLFLMYSKVLSGKTNLPVELYLKMLYLMINLYSSTLVTSCMNHHTMQ